MFILAYALLLLGLPLSSYASDVNSIQITTKKVTDEGNCSIPYWNADGTALSVNCADEPTGKSRWLSVRPDGSQKQLISTYIPKIISHDGKHYLFVDKDYYLNIGSIDGNKARRLPNNAKYVTDYRWSPDGTKIAFYYGFRLYLVNADGSNLQELIRFDGKGDVKNIAWSPDGGSIALGLHHGNMWGKYDAKSGLVLYAVGLNPIWSPDGSLIYSIDDGKLKAFTPTSLSTSADLADAGDHDVQFYDIDFNRGVIVYVFDYSGRRKNRDNNIWITDLKGTTHRKITEGKDAKGFISFNKDGHYVAYYHQDPFPPGSGPGDHSPTDIYVIELNYSK
jgi:Tol biopolymer transport system component